jgi:hypothetical protein
MDSANCAYADSSIGFTFSSLAKDTLGLMNHLVMVVVLVVVALLMHGSIQHAAGVQVNIIYVLVPIYPMSMFVPMQSYPPYKGEYLHLEVHPGDGYHEMQTIYYRWEKTVCRNRKCDHF